MQNDMDFESVLMKRREDLFRCPKCATTFKTRERRTVVVKKLRCAHCGFYERKRAFL